LASRRASIWIKKLKVCMRMQILCRNICKTLLHILNQGQITFISCLYKGDCGHFLIVLGYYQQADSTPTMNKNLQVR
jgi:hypothetical protein